MTMPTYDKETFDKEKKERWDEICRNIYIVWDFRTVDIQYHGKHAKIIEYKKSNPRIEIHFYYEDNPYEAIDDSDTGSGYYPASPKDKKLANKIKAWYIYSYRDNNMEKFKYTNEQPRFPDVLMSDGTITNSPETYINSCLYKIKKK